MSKEELIKKGWIEKDGKFYKEGSFMCSDSQGCKTFVCIEDAITIQRFIDEFEDSRK